MYHITEMKNKASDMHEVRRMLSSDRYIIGHKSNDSITYYAQNEEDAKRTLALWDAAPEMLEALQNTFSILVDCCDNGTKPNFIDLRDLEQVINKAQGK